jgi:hypothetical protein
MRLYDRWVTGNAFNVGSLLVGWWESQYDPVEYSGDMHQLIVAGTGGGKFTANSRRLWPRCCSGVRCRTIVVVDPKGEIAKLAGPFFQTPFSRK